MFFCFRNELIQLQFFLFITFLPEKGKDRNFFPAISKSFIVRFCEMIEVQINNKDEQKKCPHIIWFSLYQVGKRKKIDIIVFGLMNKIIPIGLQTKTIGDTPNREVYLSFFQNSYCFFYTVLLIFMFAIKSIEHKQLLTKKLKPK